MLSLKMLLRGWRGGRLALIFGALVLAVAIVSSVALLADRVEKALIDESSSFLAADLVIRSSRAIEMQWQDVAEQLEVETAKTAQFSSMVFHGEQVHLASVKAVEHRYPLRGALKRSKTAFTYRPELIETAEQGPDAGEVWVDSRLLPLLNIDIGDTIEVGEAQLRVAYVLVEEPDRSGTSSLFGARVLMNWQDLAASGVVQPGSQVDYRLLAAGEAASLDEYLDWLEPKLDVHQRVITPDEAQVSVGNALERGRRFLLLAGSIGVVLAGVALALASRQFAESQVQQVALMKSWGVSAKRVRRLYLQQALWMGIVGSLIGLGAGYLFQELLIAAVREWLPVNLPPADWKPWLTGLATGLLCLVGFTLPALWHLPSQSPLAVLRREVLSKPVNLVGRGSVGVIAVTSLLFWYSDSVRLSLAILLGLSLTALMSMIVGLLLLKLGKTYGHWMGSIWRLALANLWRRRPQSLVQMAGFSGAISLLMIMAIIRTSLIDEWRWQLDEYAPNHFLLNVAPYELDEVKTLIQQRQLETAGWYSMVRGRLVEINDAPPDALLKESHESLNRELNLSWTSNLPEGNEIVEGEWWESLALEGELPSVIPVSLEYELAEELGLSLGDKLTFSVGGLSFRAVISNTRSLNWDNMTPNFYFLFPEGVLENFPRSFISSLYVPPEEKLFVNDLLRAHPTIQVIELDKVIDRIRTIVTQITRGLELMTVLILGCGVLVMFAAVSMSMNERLQESAVLRTMGSSRRLILGVQWVEFAALGLMAGVIAAMGAELAIALLQRYMFELPFRFHPWLWLLGPLPGSLLIGLLGLLYSRKVVTQPPLQVLNSL